MEDGVWFDAHAYASCDLPLLPSAPILFLLTTETLSGRSNVRKRLHSSLLEVCPSMVILSIGAPAGSLPFYKIAAYAALRFGGGRDGPFLLVRDDAPVPPSPCPTRFGEADAALRKGGCAVFHLGTGAHALPASTLLLLIASPAPCLSSALAVAGRAVSLPLFLPRPSLGRHAAQRGKDLVDVARKGLHLVRRNAR